MILLQKQFLEKFKEWERELGLLNSSKKNSWLWAIAAVTLLACIGIIHYLLSPKFTLSLTYLIPVGFASWYIGTHYGLFLSVLSVATWIFVETASTQAYSPIRTYFLYAIARLSFCVGTTLLLGRFKTALNAERTLSRVDYLTGAMNWRSFYESASMEIERCNRYGCNFSMAYIDIDNFKDLNDRCGHTIGDNVLRAIANTVKMNIRKVDIVARLGGDEFVILSPETTDKVASAAIKKIKNALEQHKYLKKFSITVSIGILICKACPPSVDRMTTLADSLMYSAKKRGKNEITQSIYTG